MKVHLVSRGHYSDYSIYGVYSTAEKSEYAKKLFASDNDIEEMELDEIPQHPPGMLYWEVLMDVGGNSSVTQASAAGTDYNPVGDWAPYGDSTRVAFYVWAVDRESAVKIANEKRVALLASGQWTTDWPAWYAANPRKD